MADLDSIIVGAFGHIYSAPTDSTMPTTATEALDAAFVDIGTISEDGLSTDLSQDNTEINQWGGQTVRVIRSSETVTFAFTCLESNPEVINRYYSTTVAAGAAAIGGGTSERRAWVFDVLDGDTHLRYTIPEGEVTERGTVTYKADEAASYEFTVTAYPFTGQQVGNIYSDAVSWSV